MKNNFGKLVALVVACATLLSFTACGGGKKTAVATKYDASKAKVYSMDLTDIAGYSDAKYKVTNGTWAETYDVLIGAIKKESDPTKRFELMHKAEDLLMSTGDIVPLYYYTDVYMKSKKINGFFSSPLGYKYFMYTTVQDAESLPVCIASEPQTIDPALNSAVDGATLIIHLFSGLVKYDSTGTLVADCAESPLPTPVAGEGTEVTYTFTLQEGLKWSDNSELKASDFEYAWKRAASKALGADYGYMFDCIKGYGGKDDANGLAPLAVTANDEARTLAVTLNVDLPYFFELCAFPTYMPIKRGDNTPDNEGKWITDKGFVCNGAYTMTEWNHKTSIKLTKNDKYHDAQSITMDEVVFYLSDSDTTMLSNFETGDWLFIDSVPNAEIDALKTKYHYDETEKDPDQEFFVGSQLGTYYVCFNNNLDFLPSSEENDALSVEDRQRANTEIRNALSLLLDRDYICKEICQAGEEPAGSFVALGLTEPDGTQFYQNAGDDKTGSKNYFGYYDATADANASNQAKAVETLKQYFKYDEKKGKFTNFPKFTYLYNNGTGHQAIGEYFQAALDQYGIKVQLENQEWATFLETRKNGDYGVARNGWLGDYNDPISFLDMWTTDSGNNDVQFGK